MQVNRGGLEIPASPGAVGCSVHGALQIGVKGLKNAKICHKLNSKCLLVLRFPVADNLKVDVCGAVNCGARGRVRQWADLQGARRGRRRYAVSNGFDGVTCSYNSAITCCVDSVTEPFQYLHRAH